MRTRSLSFISLVLGAALSQLSASPALAESASTPIASTLPAGVFLMADGKYFFPKGRMNTANLDEILAYIAAQQNPTTPPPPPPVVADTTPSLKKAIVRARAELATRAKPIQETTLTTDDVWRDVELALWNPTADVLRYRTAQKKDNALRMNDSTQDVVVDRANGVNSTYRVKGTAGELVVGVRYPLLKNVGTEKKPVFTAEDVIYTPDSQSLRTPEMVKVGEAWLDKVVSDVFLSLRADGVRSRPFPDKLLADVVDPVFVKSLLFIEHVDEGVIKNNPRAAYDSFFLILAANENASYGYSRSSAGARGLGQFMPATYAAMAKKSALKLDPNFERAAQNAPMTVRATVAYIDDLLGDLPKTTREEYQTNRDLVQEYIAASYNGGPARVRLAMQVWEENFDANERPKIRTRSRLKEETLAYVRKLRAVRPLLRERDTVSIAVAK